MPGVLPSEGSGPARGSPSKKNRLSLKLFQKKEAKRALDFTESQENEQKSSEFRGSEVYVRVSLFVPAQELGRWGTRSVPPSLHPPGQLCVGTELPAPTSVQSALKPR